jgi:CRISPR-associated protein Csx16
MSLWFITRHPGAVDWALRQGLKVDHWLAHADIDQVQRGDTVAGTLPVHLAARVCERGAVYLHLSLDLPPHLRGQELTADQLTQAGARLQAYVVSPSRPSEACG